MDTKTDIYDDKPEKKRVGVRNLRTPEDARRLLARLIRLRLAGSGIIDDACLRACTGALSVFLKAVEQADTEARLEALERRLDEAEASL